MPPMREPRINSPEERKDLEALLFEIRKVGVNLNQLAHRTNRSRLLGTSRPARSAIDEAARSAAALTRLIINRL